MRQTLLSVLAIVRWASDEGAVLQAGWRAANALGTALGLCRTLMLGLGWRFKYWYQQLASFGLQLESLCHSLR